MRSLTGRVAGCLVALMLAVAGPAAAQKRGGVMAMPLIDTPPSPSLHEEATVSVVVPFMSMFNNLVMFDQHQMQNRDDTIVPDLATKWAWDDTRTKLTFTLR